MSATATATVLPFRPPRKGDAFTARKFAWLDQVTADQKLSPGAVRFAVLLASQFLNRDTGDAWPSQPTLARQLGLSTRWIRRLSRELESAGHLTVTVHRGRTKSNRYRPIVNKTGTVLPVLGPENRNDRALKTGTILPPTSFEENPLKLGRLNRHSAGSKEYAFEGSIIRVTAVQKERWERTYPGVPDIVAELQLCDDFLAGQEKVGNWFYRTSAWLKRTNDREAAKRRAVEREHDSW